MVGTPYNVVPLAKTEDVNVSPIAPVDGELNVPKIRP